MEGPPGKVVVSSEIIKDYVERVDILNKAWTIASRGVLNGRSWSSSCSVYMYNVMKDQNQNRPQSLSPLDRRNASDSVSPHSYHHRPYVTASAMKDSMPSVIEGRLSDDCAADRLLVVKRRWKLRSDELKQLEELTSGISGSSGSARTISTHYSISSVCELMLWLTYCFLHCTKQPRVEHFQQFEG